MKLDKDGGWKSSRTPLMYQMPNRFMKELYIIYYTSTIQILFPIFRMQE